MIKKNYFKSLIFHWLTERIFFCAAIINVIMASGARNNHHLGMKNDTKQIIEFIKKDTFTN